jgi:dihydroorotase
MNIHIQHGRVIDPANQRDDITDVFVSNGNILALGKAPKNFKADQVIDAKGLWILPGLVDLAARLREPGQTHKADIGSETRAAAAAGITTLCLPPDTSPVIDGPSVVELIDRQTKAAQQSNVVTLGALTAGLKGELLGEMATLKKAGCVGVSNARKPVNNSLIMRRAFEYAATHDITVHIEANDPALGNGCAHEGAVATRLGLPPISAAAETAAIAQQLELMGDSGVRVHFGRLSCARSVEMINQARDRGLKVSADVAAHQLHLTEQDIAGFNSHCHVLPPLRTQRDMEALRLGLRNGVINAICSDHQPHDRDAKLAPFPSTEPGMSTLQTLLPLTLKLVNEDQLDLMTAIASITWQPAQILGIDAGTLGTGKAADMCILDPDTEWLLLPNQIPSRGKNTPFVGWSFTGKVIYTLVNGEIVFSAD